MVTVSIRCGSDIEVTASGHADAGLKGQDLVCCSVSVLLQNWEAALKALCSATVNSEKKSGRLCVKITGAGHDETLLTRSLQVGLIILEREYPEKIKISVEDTHGRSQYS